MSPQLLHTRLPSFSIMSNMPHSLHILGSLALLFSSSKFLRGFLIAFSTGELLMVASLLIGTAKGDGETSKQFRGLKIVVVFLWLVIFDELIASLSMEYVLFEWETKGRVVVS